MKIANFQVKCLQKPDKFADYNLVSPEVIVEDFKVLDEGVPDHLPLLLTFQ